MKSTDAVAILAALGQPTRMEIFRLLVRSGPGGMPAGEIADALDTPRNTMSNHLSILARAGLLQSVRSSRHVIYRVDIATVQSLATFLVADCCGDRPDLCEPTLSELRDLGLDKPSGSC